jgi:hypothetical protein
MPQDVLTDLYVSTGQLFYNELFQGGNSLRQQEFGSQRKTDSGYAALIELLRRSVAESRTIIGKFPQSLVRFYRRCIDDLRLYKIPENGVMFARSMGEFVFNGQLASTIGFMPDRTVWWREDFMWKGGRL